MKGGGNVAIWKRRYAEADFLQAVVGQTIITKQTALEVPYINGCLNLIAGTIAGLPIKLYKEESDKVIEVKDKRVNLLNDDTGDLLDGYTFKYNLILDYLIYGSGYAYINRHRNNVRSLHYIDNHYISVIPTTDPIYKDVKINVMGGSYRYYDFISLARNSEDGVQGNGLVTENKEIITLAYKLLKFQRNNVETGGIKKGVIKANNKLKPEALDSLKVAWSNLYGKDSKENCIILNEGLEYKELANTPVEMQMDEMSKSIKDQICSLLKVPLSVLEGTATENVYQNFVKLTIIPIINALEAALNQTLLLEDEKSAFYFAVDTKELLKGDIEKRYKAYEIGIKNSFLQVDDVRYMEDLEPLNLDFVKLGLADVLYNPKTKEVYTPNTNQTVNVDHMKGGEKNEGTD